MPNRTMADQDRHDLPVANTINPEIQPMRRLIPVLLAIGGFARAVIAQSSEQFAPVRAAMQRLVDTVGSPSPWRRTAKSYGKMPSAGPTGKNGFLRPRTRSIL